MKNNIYNSLKVNLGNDMFGRYIRFLDRRSFLFLNNLFSKLVSYIKKGDNTNFTKIQVSQVRGKRFINRLESRQRVGFRLDKFGRLYRRKGKFRLKLFRRFRSFGFFIRLCLNRLIFYILKYGVREISNIKSYRQFRMFFKQKRNKFVYNCDFYSKKIWRRSGRFYIRKLFRFSEICERFKRRTVATIKPGLGFMKTRSFKFRIKRDIFGSFKFGHARCFRLTARPVRLTTLFGIVVTEHRKQLTKLLRQLAYLKALAFEKQFIYSEHRLFYSRSIIFGLFVTQMRYLLSFGRRFVQKKKHFSNVLVKTVMLRISVKPSLNNFIIVLSEKVGVIGFKPVGRFSYGLLGLHGKKTRRRSSTIRQMVNRLFKFMIFLRRKKTGFVSLHKISRGRKRARGSFVKAVNFRSFIKYKYRIRLILKPFFENFLTKKFLKIFLMFIRRYNKLKKKRQYKRLRFKYRHFKLTRKLHKIYSKYGIDSLGSKIEQVLARKNRVNYLQTRRNYFYKK